MDYKELIKELRRYEHLIPWDKKAADAIEALLAEQKAAVVHAHVVVNWLGDCRCSNCNENIDSTSNYCNWCGAKLDEPEQRED